MTTKDELIELLLSVNKGLKSIDSDDFGYLLLRFEFKIPRTGIFSIDTDYSSAWLSFAFINKDKEEICFMIQSTDYENYKRVLVMRNQLKESLKKESEKVSS